MTAFHQSFCVWATTVFAALAVFASAEASASAFEVTTVGSTHELSLDGGVFHVTDGDVVDPQVTTVDGSTVRLLTWREVSPDGDILAYYAISLHPGAVSRARRTGYQIKLRYGSFDPLLGEPQVPTMLQAAPDSDLYMVQFITAPVEAMREALRDLGATVLIFLADHVHIVNMSADVGDAVAGLPFVRWVGPVHAAYKLEEEILDQLVFGAPVEARRYSIMNYERGVLAQDRVSAEINALGGLVHGSTPLGFRIEATLTLAQVLVIARLDDVMFIDRKGEVEPDMDIGREIGGANFLESTLGFTGQGVRAEVADTELNVNHVEWSQPPIIHIPGGSGAHGTSVYGILFAQGINAQARGLIPDATGIFAQSSSLLGGGPTRYQHTAELVDPDGPYRAVFQTNSTGDPRTFCYTTISAEMDDLLFDLDILIVQSQSNAGNPDSRPQAWAKNIVAVGGVFHLDTLARTDDKWNFGASTGPADDGRIKPDLTHFYDVVFTTHAGGGYTQFSGTSSAAPLVAGHFGLLFQMWHEEVFEGFGGAETVFDSRPHMTTAKALLINSAYRYDWNAGGANSDLNRFRQGWGMPDLEALFNATDKLLIINETDVLTELGSTHYSVSVAPGEPAFQATMTYADLPGNPGAKQHRINDLSLRVTSPNGDVYWGNNGLIDGNESTPGGESNQIDTVENVLVANPTPGDWQIEVLADEINEDGHVETGELDVDYALIVTGGSLEPPVFTIHLLDGPSGMIPPGPVPVVVVEITPGAENIVPGSETLFYRYDTGAFVAQQLDHVLGDVYNGSFPDVECGDFPEFYISAEGDLGSIRTLPSNAPDGVFSFNVDEIVKISSDNFEKDNGWTVSGDAADGQWERGVPIIECDRGNPLSDFDGSGNCFITDNSPKNDCNSDVDDGSSILTSPVFDLSELVAPRVSYARWYSNHTGNNPFSDIFVVEISTDGGDNWETLETVGPSGSQVSGGWFVKQFPVPVTSEFRIRFIASDLGDPSVVEAGVDAFKIVVLQCVEDDATAPFVVHDSGQSTNPFTGYIDPRAESSDGKSLDLGVQQVAIRFSEPVRDVGSTGGVTASAFTVTSTGLGAPVVTEVDDSANPMIRLTLSGPIRVQQWTTIVADVEDQAGNRIEKVGNQGPGVNETDRVDIGYLPCDVTQDGTVEPVDLLRFRQIIVGAFQNPEGEDLDYVDTNRNGVIEPIDLLFFRQLLLGTGNATQPWLLETIVDRP